MKSLKDLINVANLTIKMTKNTTPIRGYIKKMPLNEKNINNSELTEELIDLKNKYLVHPIWLKMEKISENEIEISFTNETTKKKSESHILLDKQNMENKTHQYVGKGFKKIFNVKIPEEYEELDLFFKGFKIDLPKNNQKLENFNGVFLQNLNTMQNIPSLLWGWVAQAKPFTDVNFSQEDIKNHAIKDNYEKNKENYQILYKKHIDASLNPDLPIKEKVQHIRIAKCIKNLIDGQ